METKKKATAAAEAARHERLRALTLAEHGRKQADQHQKKAVAARQAASASESMVTMLTDRLVSSRCKPSSSGSQQSMMSTELISVI